MPSEWIYWTNTGTAVSTATSNNLTFKSWVLDTTVTTTTIYTNEWQSWVNQPVTLRPYAQAAQPAYTPAELRQRDIDLKRRLAENERRRKAAEREAAVAQRKAKRLLLSHLTPEQRDEYQRLERFTVIAADGRTYRVHRKWSHNLELVEDTAEGRFITEQLCVHPREQTPTEDSMLIQKLMLETDPDTLRRIANITRLQRRVEAA